MAVEDEPQSKKHMREEGTVDDQAMAWVMLLASGEFTEADAIALRRWREEDATYQRAFAEAKLLWETLGAAAKDIAMRPDVSTGSRSDETPPLRLGRRAFIGGALAASVATVGYFSAYPPLRLWPSIAELNADYRTKTGEQRELALAKDVSLLLNTQTSIGVKKIMSAAPGIELISGEAAVTANATAAAPFDV